MRDLVVAAFICTRKVAVEHIFPDKTFLSQKIATPNLEFARPRLYECYFSAFTCVMQKLVNKSITVLFMFSSL